MFFRSSRWLYVLVGVLTAGLCVLIYVRKQQIQEEQRPRPFGQFTEAQIADRTEPLFHLLAPGSNCWMAFSQDTGGRPDGSTGRFWSVDCLRDSQSDAAT